MDFGFRWDTTYRSLPAFFYQVARPEVMPDPKILCLNRGLAQDLALDAARLEGVEGASFFAGHGPYHDTQPLAQAYAGHQFGRFTMLGDGRALLYGEHVTPDGRRFDVHLKGTGPTLFSRRGDGRAALAPMLREYMISEAMHALGIPTTRSLAVIGTGEEVFRHKAHPGALLVRVADSHLRVGTFEYAAGFHEGPDMVRELSDYAIRRHHPDLLDMPIKEMRYREFAQRVTWAQIKLVTAWMRVGFIHGVMNTDNTAISGETIDYGPCAFMDIYDPLTVFSSIDQEGRYAFARQPEILQWNLARFWEAMLPLLHVHHDDAVKIATDCLRGVPVIFKSCWLQMMRDKLGWSDEYPDAHPNDQSNNQSNDYHLIQQLLDLMQRRRLDYTHTFLSLTRVLEAGDRAKIDVSKMDSELGLWAEAWRRRIDRQAGGSSFALKQMRRANPVFIPRNHLVEEALSLAEHEDDWSSWEQLISVLQAPYQEQSGRDRYEAIPADPAKPYKTFCGT
jgi:uncharacterized protein YdiU (UPF0061 family)